MSISGRGGASIYGRQFDDEINIELKHTGMYINLSELLVVSEMPAKVLNAI